MTIETSLRPIRIRPFPAIKQAFNLALSGPLVLLFLPWAGAQNAPPLAQTPAQGGPAATVQVNVKVVSMPVTVRDKHGAIVSNLSKDDFSLAEDGKPQAIKYFNHDTNLPLNLGLLVDTSMSQRNVLDDERTASQHFLDQMVTDKQDRAFVVQFDREVDLLEDLTADKGKLRTAIDQLGAPQFQRTSNAGDSSDPDQSQGHHHYGGGTTLYDAIYLASNEVMKQQKGRKAIVVLTDGVDRGSKETLNSAIEAAQRSDTVVYALYYKGEEGHSNGGGYPGGGGGRRGGWGYPGGGGGYPGGGGGGYPGSGPGGQRPQQEPHVDGKKILEQICSQTGGRMFEVTKKETADQAYTTIAEEMRSQYMLGYTPDKSSDAGYHKIALTANKKDLIVQTREGYYAD